MSRLWKINCMEDTYPDMWQRWFKNQCVAVGYASSLGYQLHEGSQGRGWTETRRDILNMSPGDYVVVSLKHKRVGRIGQITGKTIEDDQWNPLVPKSKTLPDGEMGRRILVRWELTTGPESHDLIIQLPENRAFAAGNETLRAVSEITSMKVDDLREIMNNQKNWINLSGKFNYERAISDYIAYYSHHLEDGLFPHPDLTVREHVFKDRTRSDVLLIDRLERLVVVECKQYAPTIGDLKQLRGYMQRLKVETGKEPRGILIHGGTQKVSEEVTSEASSAPVVEIVSYSLKVDFRPSF